MNLAADGPMAIPLWIDGRAYLTVPAAFFDVISPRSGEALRRVPLCGADEARAAATAAGTALAAWHGRPAEDRQAALHTLAAALEGYAGHFAKLIAEETGCDENAAAGEVAAAVAALRTASPTGTGGVVALVIDAGRPLAALAEIAAPALAGGATLVCKPSPKAPSAAFALCELATRAGWPAGVINLLQGDQAAVEGLCAAPGIARVAYAGAAELGNRIAAIAARHGLPFTAAA